MAPIGILSYLLPILPFLIFILVPFFLKQIHEIRSFNWPLFGMIPSVAFRIPQIHDFITEVLQQAGGTFKFKGIWFARLDFLLTANPSNIHHILVANFEGYTKGPDFKYIFDALGDGIFNSEFDSWKTQRRTALALFRHHNFLQFLEKTVTNKVKEGLVPVLESVCENGSVLDLQDLFQRFSFDSTCMLVTGFDLHSLSLEFPQVPFSKAMDEAEQVIFLRHIFPKKLWELQKKLQIGQAKRLKEAVKIADETIAKLIVLKRESLKQMKEETDQDQEFDLITPYITDANMDDKSLRDTFLTFMVAGRDTLSSALSWFFYCVSSNPIVESKIREELKTIIIHENNETAHDDDDHQWRLFSIEELKKLVYFHAAICETLRLYPPIPFQHKVPIQPDILPSGHRVNPKIKILFSLYALGRMRDVWGEDCMEFKPERWISENGMIKHVPSHKFAAFSAGPRTCLGKEVTFTVMKIVAATIIHNYHITQQVEDDHYQVVPSASVILQMKHGFKVKIARRWSSN